MKVNINIDPAIFNSCYRPYLDDDTYVQIFYGGSSSGKSFFLAQRLVYDMLRGGHNYFVCRKQQTAVKKSVFNEVCKAISAFNASKLFTINKSNLIITCVNGYQVLFGGLDDPEKVKSITPAQGVITDIWVEEATDVAYEDVKQLRKRLRGRAKVNKRLILSFNPIYQLHWIYQQFFAGHWSDDTKTYKTDDLTILKTTYADNTFLTDGDIHELESEGDPYWRNVYTYGNWGILGKAIFTNWHTEDLSSRQDDFDSYENGLDFGYANDPTALVRCHYSHKNNTLYILKAKYCFGYTNDLIAAECQNLFGREVVVCDCAEPKSIQELRQYGVTTTPAVKGKDSILFGIQWLQKLNIVIDSSLTEAVNEFTTYKWAEDKEGNVLPKPVDKNNHIIDAIRYACGQQMQWSGNRQEYNNVAWPKMGAM